MRLCLAVGFGALHLLASVAGRLPLAVKFAGFVFRRSGFASARSWATKRVRILIEKHGARSVGDAFFALTDVPADRLDAMREQIGGEGYVPRSRVIMLAEKTEDAKGVLLVKYSATFPVFRALFDLEKLGRDYLVVLEPSYSGALEPQLLCLIGQGIDIVVEAGEPVDFDFFAELGEFKPVGLAANHWVDGRVFHPIENVAKEFDLVLVSIWSDHKRHYSLFEAMSKVADNRKLRVALVGVPVDRDIDYIKDLAAHFGVLDQLTFYEGIQQQEINELLARSRAAVLLSRKEGFNKACIEAMFAGVPSFLLEGHNFGHHYKHVNEATGGFIDGAKLDEFLLNLDSILASSKLDPANWVRGAYGSGALDREAGRCYRCDRAVDRATHQR